MGNRMQTHRLGIWMIGARGSVATTVIAGALALKKQLVPRLGMITDADVFRDIDLVQMENLVFGGCDIRNGSIEESIGRMCLDNACIDARILEEIGHELEQIEPFIGRGTLTNCGEAIQGLSAEKGNRKTLLEEIEHIRSQIRRFKRKSLLKEVVVINLSSTEPLLKLKKFHMQTSAFEKRLASNQRDSIRASTLYAYSALMEDCPFINFNASNGALIPAIIDIAERRRLPVMGNDGKTGQTLIKSALAPLFTSRSLEVLSWEGFNLLGNMDGQVLDHKENKEAKLKTKDHSLSRILGYSPHTKISIDYVPSLGDQKTAWDFIHFRGFMGIPMIMQVIWQGFDSILAAPLILDMARLADLAKRNGQSGLMPQLALFFKAPIGVDEQRLYEQYRMLLDYVAAIRRSRNKM